MNKTKTKTILGISAYYHDSAAAIIQSGNIIAAAQEERFSRIKHDPSFPGESILFCLEQVALSLEDIDAIVFYDKPFLTFDRLIETYLSFVPRGIKSFLKSMPVWTKEKLFLKSQLRKQLLEITGCTKKNLPPLLFTEHHQSHASSAFFPSPFEEAAVLCIDGVGEWATTSAWVGAGSELKPLWQINFPHSLGLLYSAFTYFCGFKVNSGEYKLMGLAPYGEPIFTGLIKEKLIDIKSDGSFRLHLHYFDYCIGETMTSTAFNDLFGGPPRGPESPITKRELDIAASIQVVLEEVVTKLAITIKNETGVKNLCLAGGVALNCTANEKLVSAGIFDGVWIQPAAGDAGGAVGAALAAWHLYFNGPRETKDSDSMQGAFLGPEFSNQYIESYLEKHEIPYRFVKDDDLYSETALLIDRGNVVGWFQGKMEFGPRALGNRSILGDARSPVMQSKINTKIKFRESFRPFAPAVIEEKANEYFEMEGPSPYMLFVSPVKDSLRISDSEHAMSEKSGLDKLECIRSKIPAVTHIDYTARFQTVSLATNPRFHKLISAFDQLTGCGVIINTSFNIRGEPMVCTPKDAWHCFVNTDMDFLVMGNYIVDKSKQSIDMSSGEYLRQFELD